MQNPATRAAEEVPRFHRQSALMLYSKRPPQCLRRRPRPRYERNQEERTRIERQKKYVSGKTLEMKKYVSGKTLEIIDDTNIASGALFESSGTVTLQGTFEVHSIRLGPNIAGKYLVHWEGYGADGDAWEPKANLPAEMVEKYMAWRFDDDSDSN